MGELGLRPEIPTPPRPEDSDSSGTAAEARTRGAPHTCTQDSKSLPSPAIHWSDGMDCALC